MLEAKYARKTQALGDQRAEHREAEFTCSVSWGWHMCACTCVCACVRVRVLELCFFAAAAAAAASLLWIKQRSFMFTHFSAFSVEFQDVLKMIIQFQIQKIF